MQPEFPFPGALKVPPLTPREIDANNEHNRQRWLAEDRKAMAKKPNVANLRDTIIQRLAPDNPGPQYDPQARQLVEQFEAALRESWEHAERGLVRQRAETAIRNALEAVADGKLL